MVQIFGRSLVLASLLVVGLVGGADATAGTSRGRCESLFQVKLIPSDVTVHKMNPDRVVVSEVRPSHEWTESMVKIRTEMLALKHPKGNQWQNHDRAVLYPMSGFDLATPLILFPKAETYILIDNHSLMKPTEVRRFLRTSVELDYVDRNSSWIRYDRTGDDIFPKLMTALFAHAPKSEIASIELYVDKVENVSAKIVVRMNDGSSSTASEKTIWYLVGEVGHVDRDARADAQSRRSYNADSEKSVASSASPWWGDLVDGLAARTLLVKGSMSGLRPTKFNGPLPWRERLVTPILRDGGLIVEGSSNFKDRYHDAEWALILDPKRSRWEFTDGDPRFKRSRARVDLENVEFSYARNVRIGFYDPQPSASDR